MKPPICEFCDDDFRSDDTGGLLYFTRDAHAQEWHDRQREEGFVGHPPEAAWFCGVHYPAAEKLTHLSLSEAMQELRKQF